MIIAVSGKPLSGKSYFVDQLVEKLTENGIPVTKFSIGEPIKNAVFSVLGFYPDKYTDRDIYQEVGTAFRNKYGNDVFARFGLLRLANWLHYNNPISVILIDDVRFPEEIELLKPDLKIRIEASEEIRRERLQKIRPGLDFVGEDHPTETSLDDYEDWDVVVKVDTKEDERQLEEFVCAIVE